MSYLSLRGILYPLYAGALVSLILLAPQTEAQPEGVQPEEDEPISAATLVDYGSVISGRDAPQWNPNRESIAVMSSLFGGLDLASVPSDGGAPKRLVRDLSLVGTGTPGSQKPQFSPDGQYVAYVSSKSGPNGGDPLTEGGDAPEIWLHNLETKENTQLTTLGSRINALRWSPDSETILFTSDRYGSQDVWTVDVESGQATRLTSDSRYEVYPDWHPSGDEIVYVRMDSTWTDHTVLKMPASGGEAEVIFRDTDFFDYRAGLAFGTPRVSPSGDFILFRSLRSGWHNFWVTPYNPDSDQSSVQIAAAEADQSHARWSPDGEEIVYLEKHNGTTDLRRVSFEPDGEKPSFTSPEVVVDPERMGRVYGENGLAMGAAAKPEWSPDGSKISFTYTTPRRPEDLFVVGLDGGGINRLTTPTTDYPATSLGKPEKVSYESTDGFTIHGYLYLPEGVEAGEAPGIVWVHGGPTSQFTDEYSYYHDEVRYFVQRGYAVLMPNVRGSSGYGKEFEDANNECWGRCDLEDVRAGVEFLEEKEVVNGEKMGITGTSYGGILSMSAVAFAPGLFQAAIPTSGYGNLAKLHTDVPELQHIKLLNYELGPYPESKEVYRRHSAIHYVDNVTTPTFLMHGYGRDIPWRQAQKDPEMASINFARALDQRYKIFRYKRYPGESYYIYGEDNTIQKLKDKVTFFDQFLKDDVNDKSDLHSVN